MRPFELVKEGSIEKIAWDCFDCLDENTPVEYRELASLLAIKGKSGGFKTIGISGGQGCGKSTLCKLIDRASAVLGERVAILGLDDFYLTKQERTSLAGNVHELLVTRGPPGTHDIRGLLRVVDTLRNGNSCTVPVFDKGLDERSGYRIIKSGVERVILEGWCVGARREPSSRLELPINALEAQFDTKGIWRTWINKQLAGPYQDLRSKLDLLVFVQVPGIESVRHWRLQQELERPAHLRMDSESIHKFVEHYERITHWMVDDLSTQADIVVELGKSHEIVSLRGL